MIKKCLNVGMINQNIDTGKNQTVELTPLVIGNFQLFSILNPNPSFNFNPKSTTAQLTLTLYLVKELEV